MGIEQRAVTLSTITAQLSASEATALRQAYDLACQLYGRERTLANMPKIEHALHTADTVIELGLDGDAAAAALLSHVHGDEALRQVEQHCGREVAQLIGALRQLDIYTGESQGKRPDTLEAIRRAVLNVVAGDARVVVIRLAIALQTLAAAGTLPQEQRSLIAKDVQALFAPLANRLGIWQMKWELEDLSFRYLNPQAYQEIAQALDERRNERQERVERARQRLQQALHEVGIEAEVTGRPKHIYSIHRKMVRKDIDFAEVFDAHALRVVIPGDEPTAEELRERRAKQRNQDKRDKAPQFQRSAEQKAYDKQQQQRAIENCYRALGIVHSLYVSIPEEFDDYIQYPKSNGYRSLHTAVNDETERVLEIQIRTRRMHIEAEQGFAAHWAYKEGNRPNAAMARQIQSLRRVLMQIGNFDESIEQFNPDINEEERAANKAPRERIYVFTPKGDLFDLPRGATPVDFAYSIHTNVGHRCRGAKVNGKMRPLTHQLQSGDRVEILTVGKKEEGRPSRDWLNPSAGYTTTSKARNRIRAWFRLHERQQNIEHGRTYLDRELRPFKGEVSYEELADHFDEASVADFLAKVGFGDYTSSQIQGAISLIQRDREEEEEEAADEATELPPLREAQSRSTDSLTIRGVAGLHTRMGRCCNPIPPEPIVGYITRGRGVTIHRSNCKQVLRVRELEPERVIEDVSWGGSSNDRYQIPFRLKAYRTRNLIEKIASILQGQNVQLVKSKTTSKGHHMQIYLLAEVRDIDQANWVAQKLGSMDPVFEVISQ